MSYFLATSGRGRPWRMAAVALAAWFTATPAPANKADNTLRFAIDQTLDDIDPYFNTLATGYIVADHVWDTLLYLDPDSGALRGDLATAWRWVDDKTLELDLRQGVTFHNGAAFDADDVVYTLNFVSKPENKAFPANVSWIDHVERAGKYRVRIVTKKPTPAALATLASAFLVIHPHEYYAKVGPKGVNEKPVGAGPYRVAEYSRGKYLRLERNPDYFTGGPKRQPKIDRVEIRFIPDAQTRVAEAVSGGLDLIINVDRDQAEQLRGIPSLQIASGATQRYAFLHMDTRAATIAPALRDLRVRQAIAHAIDRVTMRRFLVGEGSQVIHVECHPEQFGCSDDGAPRYDYDPAKARRLLAEAGYPNGFDLDFYAYRDRNQSEAMINYLRAVGIRARLRFMQAPAMNAAMRAGRAPLVHETWASPSRDPSVAVSVFHEFTAFDQNRDPEIRDLLERADSSLDEGVRKQAYAQAFRLIAERAYVLPLYTIPTNYVAAKDLVLGHPPDGLPKFYDMSWK